MPKPPLSPRSCAKLTPLIDILTCIECERPCTCFTHDDGRRVYVYRCPCEALYYFLFRRDRWFWVVSKVFEAHGRQWTMIYEPWGGRTSFCRPIETGSFEKREFQGYVHYERFANLLAFT